MPRTSYATLELPEDVLVMLSFPFLFTRKPTPACPLLSSEWYSRWPRWRVVKLSSFLRTSPSPITSHFMLFSFSILPVLARVHILVMFLHCMLQSSVALPLCGGSSWVLAGKVLEQINTHSYSGCVHYAQHYIISEYESMCCIRNCYMQ